MRIALAVALLLSDGVPGGVQVRAGAVPRWTAPTPCLGEADVAARFDAASRPGGPREPPAQDDGAPAPTSWKARPRGTVFADALLGFAGPPRIGAGLGGGLALVAHRIRAEFSGTFWFGRATDIGR